MVESCRGGWDSLVGGMSASFLISHPHMSSPSSTLTIKFWKVLHIPMLGARSISRTRHLTPHSKNSTFSSRPKWRPLQLGSNNHFRTFAGIHPVLLPPVVFGGLVVALWTWKCIMMVMFQNKIIYMPGLPPNARRETIQDYENQCNGIKWTEEKTVASDGTQISLCVASVDTVPNPTRTVYILYLQG